MKRSLMLSLSVAIVLLLCVCCHICVFAEEEIGIPDFGNGLTAEGASWYSNDAKAAQFSQGIEGRDCYKVFPNPDNLTYTLLRSRKTFNVKGNRNYKLSLYINTNFVRNENEVNVGFMFTDSTDKKPIVHTFSGIPSQTDGWQKFEYIFTSPAIDCKGRFFAQLSGVSASGFAGDCYFSNLSITLLDEEELIPLGVGEGLVFGGSSGNTGMTIKSVVTDSKKNIVTVKTTGASFAFDKNNKTVVCSQLINKKRKVVTLSLNKDLTNLYVFSRSDNEVVLTTGENGVSFGVQMDGMMLVSNHGTTDLDITTTSNIDGKWNRLAMGQLIARDDIGGFTVNSSIPFGSGRLPRYSVSDNVDFNDVYRDVEFISKAKKGWSIDWIITSGERLGISVFPPKEYNWDDSFEKSSYRIFSHDSLLTGYANLKSSYNMNTALLYDFTARAWGMSYSDTYTPNNVDNYTTHINTAKEAGVTPTAYMSFYFWHNRDVDEFIREVKRHRDEYGIEGIYTDGLPDMEWLASYECMRKLRELFPDGSLIVHTTGQSENGGPPLACPDIFIPAIDAYADITLRGEDITFFGSTSDYPKFVTSAYNASNSYGVIKGNLWYYSKNDDSYTKVSENDRKLINLIYGGRARIDGAIGSTAQDEAYPDEKADYFKDYYSVLTSLKENYLANGDSENYYKYHYSPLARELVRPYLTNAKDIKRTVLNIGFDAFDDTWEQHSDTNTSISVENGALKLSDSGEGLCRVEIPFDEENGSLDISYDVNKEKETAFFVRLKNNGGDTVFSILHFDNRIFYCGESGGYKEINKLFSDSDNKVLLNIDVSGGEFNLSVNGEKLLRNESVMNDLKGISGIELSTDFNTTGTVTFDNLSVLSGI